MQTKKEYKISETTIPNKFLVQQANGNTFYCGTIAKDILILWQTDTSKKDILHAIKEKYNQQLSIVTLDEIINTFLNAKTKKTIGYKHIFKLFSSSSIPKFKLLFLIKSHVYFFILILLFLLNLYYINTITAYKLDYNERCLQYLFLVIILFLHEVGHAIIGSQFSIKTGEIGIGFYGILPVFYINLNEIWLLDKVKRIVINFGGIFFQLLINAILIAINQVFYSHVI